MVLKLLALILPLGLDTFAVAAALAIAGLSPKDRFRVTALFTAFEAGMPLIGLLIGAVGGQAIGTVAEYVAIAALILLGGYMLWPRDEDEEEERLELLSRTHGLAMFGLGLSISMDELAIGFTVGLLRFPIVVVLIWIGVQTVVVTQLGMRIGTHIGEAVREGAERLAGLVLAGLGIFLLVERLVMHG